MLKEQMKQWLERQSIVKLFPEEKTYVESEQLATNVEITKIEANRFADVYIERLWKETEELIKEEDIDFLNERLSYLRKHIAQFIYIETEELGMLGIDGISLEVEDVFQVYSVLFGLKVKKNKEKAILHYFNDHLTGEIPKYSMMFNQADGLWDINFTFDYVEGFQEKMSLREAFERIYRFLFQLVVHLENETL